MAIGSFPSTWLSRPPDCSSLKAWRRYWIFEEVSLKNMLTIHSSRFSELYFCTGDGVPNLLCGAMGPQTPKDKVPLGDFPLLRLLHFFPSRVGKRLDHIKNFTSFSVEMKFKYWPLYDLTFHRSRY